MKTQAERAAEKRAEKLNEMDEQVKRGSLVIRPMTDEEKEKFGPPKPPREKKPRGR
jgi:hypothetical protein